jgi:hypothetical protein
MRRNTVRARITNVTGARAKSCHLLISDAHRGRTEKVLPGRRPLSIGQTYCLVTKLSL